MTSSPVSNDAAVSRELLRELYHRYGCCMAYITVEKDGDENIGSAFHVGDGVFVTAGHVVEGSRNKGMRLTNPNLYYRSELYPSRSLSGGERRRLHG